MYLQKCCAIYVHSVTINKRLVVKKDGRALNLWYQTNLIKILIKMNDCH